MLRINRPLLFVARQRFANQAIDQLAKLQE
jgi:hypothetical protein